MTDGGSCVPERPPDDEGQGLDEHANGATDIASAVPESGLLARPEALPLGGLMRIAAAAAGAEGAYLCVAGRAARWSAHAGIAVPATPCPCARSAAEDAVSPAGRAMSCQAKGNEGGLLLRLPEREGDAQVVLCLDGATVGPPSPRTLDAVVAEVAAILDLLAAVDRTEALRSETDHRVKNALQSVASFLRLQEARVADAHAQRVLAAAGRHVSSIALLHQEVSLATDGALVELERYLPGLGRLFRSVAPEGVAVEVDVAGGALAFDRAAALAAIANEFVSNAFKHAFPAGGPGTIRIHGTYGEDGLMRITMSDDGVGGAAETAGTGLGVRIVKAAAAKLGASLVTGPAEPCGYRLDLAFPASPHTAATGPLLAAGSAAAAA